MWSGRCHGVLHQEVVNQALRQGDRRIPDLVLGPVHVRFGAVMGWPPWPRTGRQTRTFPAASHSCGCSKENSVLVLRLHRPRSAARAPHSWLHSSIVRTMPTSRRHPGYSRPHRHRPAWKTRWSSRPRGLRASTCSGRRWPRSGWPPRLPCSRLRHMTDSPHRKTRSRSPRMMA
jgi:hypothetical protein